MIGFAPEITDPLEYPSVVVTDHEIVKGLDPGDLPEVGNLIEEPGPSFQILTASAQSNYPTLLISETSKGRVVITSSTLADAQDIRHPLSEELVGRALRWLAEESTEE